MANQHDASSISMTLVSQRQNSEKKNQSVKDIKAGGAEFDSNEFPLERENKKPIHLKVDEAKLI